MKIHPVNPEVRKVQQLVEGLGKGAVMIYPTDAVYAFGCSLDQPDAIAKICRLRGVDPKKAQFSIMCLDIAQASQYANQIENTTFRLIKNNSPGPFTFILKAGGLLPKTLKNKRKSIGIRIPDHAITKAVLRALGKPIITASLYSEDEILEYMSDPEEIADRFEKHVDFVIDGGPGSLIPSTVIDCTSQSPLIIRQGLGELS